MKLLKPGEDGEPIAAEGGGFKHVEIDIDYARYVQAREDPVYKAFCGRSGGAGA